MAMFAAGVFPVLAESLSLFLTPVAHREFDFKRFTAVLAGHWWNIGSQIIRTDKFDQLVKIESVEVPAAFIPAESLQLHAAGSHSAKGPVAHGLLLAGFSERNSAACAGLFSGVAFEAL